MVNLLCEHSELFSETWPTSGMMLDGKVYALPTQAHRTTDSESSLLRSPKANDGARGALGEATALERGNSVQIGDQVLDLAAQNGLQTSRRDLMPTPSAAQEPGFTTQPVDKNGNPTNNPNERWYHPETGRLMQKGITQALNAVLPTPIVRDYKDGSSDVLRGGEVQTDTLARAVFSSGEISLMPTLRASDGYERRNQKTMDKIAAEGGDMTMPTLARTTTDWGKFEPAIRRWEDTLGRPAPAPTKPDGKDGAHRLSSEFTEWMMGVPHGWITGVGLTRNDELKACGNGVVPQQAELALGVLLEGVEL
jgi:hypothetical protein